MAGAAAFAVVSGSALPVLLGAGLELMYLSLVPNMKPLPAPGPLLQWEERRSIPEKSSALCSASCRPRCARVYPMWLACVRRFASITAGCRRPLKCRQQMEEKLQGCRQGYVRLLWAAHQQREYLQLTNPADIQRELDH